MEAHGGRRTAPPAHRVDPRRPPDLTRRGRHRAGAHRGRRPHRASGALLAAVIAVSLSGLWVIGAVPAGANVVAGLLSPDSAPAAGVGIDPPRWRSAGDLERRSKPGSRGGRRQSLETRVQQDLRRPAQNLVQQQARKQARSQVQKRAQGRTRVPAWLADCQTEAGGSGAPNGQIPESRLCRLPGGFSLRGDAAEAWWRLAQRYESGLDESLCVTGGYRSLEAQRRLYAIKPGLAARPGTSNHGWGVAVDVCGGAQSFGTEEYRWLLANAREQGWVNPAWAQAGGTRPEPWHWEYVGSSGQ